MNLSLFYKKDKLCFSLLYSSSMVFSIAWLGVALLFSEHKEQGSLFFFRGLVYMALADLIARQVKIARQIVVPNE